MKLSNHSKERMKQRANVTRNQERFFRNALNNGLSLKQIKDEELQKWIKARIKYNSSIKVYKNWAFVYSRNAKQLYTMYELPEELKNKE